MRKATAVVLAIAGVGSAIHLLPQSSRTSAGDVASFGSTTAGSGPTTSIAAAEPAAASRPARVVSLNQPLLAKPSLATDTAPAPRASIPSQLPAAAAVTPTLPTIAASSNGGRRLSSSRPADDDARRELVKDLQRELKRVGCYDGEINGAWTLGSRKAMTAFTERVNATLPLDEPDYILLTLVQGHTAQACGLGCPGGQALNDAGKCVPRAILAQSAKRHGDKAVAAHSEARVAVAHVAPAPRVASTWSTVVTTTPQQPTATPLPPTRQAPLSGRMSIGAPVEAAAAPEPANVNAVLQRRKSELAAAAAAQRTAETEIERGRRFAEAQARKDRELLALRQLQAETAATRAKSGASEPRPAQSIAALAIPSQQLSNAAAQYDEQELSDNAAIAAAARRAVLSKPSSQLPHNVISEGQPTPSSLQATAAARTQSPRPPSAVGRIVVSAARPGYASQPIRWTRSIFSDITRMR